MEDFSFVYSIYNLGGAQGIIGVMGPKRMAYSKTMGLIIMLVGKLINSLIQWKEKKNKKSFRRQSMQDKDIKDEVLEEDINKEEVKEEAQ